eukprot:COSAG01_NODE_18457_length_1074_cov_2.508718_2_plen_130_part_00
MAGCNDGKTSHSMFERSAAPQYCGVTEQNGAQRRICASAIGGLNTKKRSDAGIARGPRGPNKKKRSDVGTTGIRKKRSDAGITGVRKKQGDAGTTRGPNSKMKQKEVLAAQARAKKIFASTQQKVSPQR